MELAKRRIRVAGLSLSLLLFFGAASAWAQDVVVFKFEGDRKGKVQRQVEAALKKGGKVSLFPLKRYSTAAASRGLRGPRSQTPSAFARVAGRLKLDAAVQGEVGGSSLSIVILDPRGDTLWTKKIPLQKGALSPANARRLAAAIHAAAQPPAPPPAETVSPVEPPPVAPPPPPVAEAPAAPVPPPVAEVAPTPEPVVPAESVAEVPFKGKLFLPRVQLYVGGTTTWRRYCARPGASSCSEFDGRPSASRVGNIVDFLPDVPYLGFALELKLFPLMLSDSWIRGFGAIVGYQRGFSLTTVRVVTATGETPPQEVSSSDTGIVAMLAYRYLFGFGPQPLTGFVGVHGGVMTRSFTVDQTATDALPGAHRGFPLVGLEVSVPLARLVRIEAAGDFYVNPRPGRGLSGALGSLESEISDYGETVDSFGWGAELGVAGEIWGPLGYSLRFRLSNFKDTFSGAGSSFGWSDGGVAEETYSSLHWGLTLSY